METFARVPVHVPGLVSVPTIEAPVFPLVQKELGQESGWSVQCGCTF